MALAASVILPRLPSSFLLRSRFLSSSIPSHKFSPLLSSSSSSSSSSSILRLYCASSSSSSSFVDLIKEERDAVEADAVEEIKESGGGGAGVLELLGGRKWGPAAEAGAGVKLSVKERKELVSYAHGLGKKLKSQQVGKSGVTPSLAASFVENLESNELLKLKVHGTCPGELNDVIKQLEEATGSVAVDQIGRSVILYRPSLTKMKKREAASLRKSQQRKWQRPGASDQRQHRRP